MYLATADVFKNKACKHTLNTFTVKHMIAPCPPHHYLLDPSDQVCRCEGDAHYHAECLTCGDRRVYPVTVERDWKENMQALAVMMGIHHYDEAPKGGIA